jgi:hypothetical protein
MAGRYSCQPARRTVAVSRYHWAKMEMSRRLSTSRSALDRLLDPANDAVTLLTLSRAITPLVESCAKSWCKGAPVLRLCMGSRVSACWTVGHISCRILNVNEGSGWTKMNGS